ncbi:MAG: tRNA lysidine(34) synthetase TilS [Anaerolineae bacterium]|nr:tRNA lysidine(34) synthetase TilS [Anaerolineae bacterium]MDH7472594.1 tRNA lysidine(34) synthetase TilS [Anaerolineae bacterium]
MSGKILNQVRETIEHYHLLDDGETVVVGVSGGPDSLCLLHILRQLSTEFDLRLHVAHLHHRIRGEDADADAAFVAALAQEWGLPCTVETRDVPAMAREKKLAVEEMARLTRYAFLARLAHHIGAGKIAVGHNADDQTETVLMHWLRGSGLAGLRGMLPLTPLRQLRLHLADPDLELESWHLYLIRPLLEVTRADIEAYCAAHGLQPRFDRSNLDTTYYRNRLRHELLPLLETYNPAIRQVLRRSARVITDDYALLRAEMRWAWRQVVLTEDRRAITFDLDCWRELPTSLQRATLREAIHRLRRSLRNINFVHVEDAMLVAREKPTGSQATLPRGLMLTLGYDTFVVADADYIPPPDWPALTVSSLPLNIPGVTPLPDSPWRVVARVVPRHKLPAWWVDNTDPWQAFLDFEVVGRELILRRREPGDRFCPLGLGGDQKLVGDFLINAKVPRVWRDLVPIVASPHHIVWIAGWRVDERARVTMDTERVLHLAFRR